MNFGGISEIFSGYKKSKVVVIPVPFDATSTWIKGADKGPDAILEASENMELYDIDTDSEVYKIGIHTSEVLATDEVEEMVEFTEKKMRTLFKDKKFPVIIGGNHSVSIGAFRAVSELYKDEITIVQLDAHSDLRPSYEGSELNHACVMSRAKENAVILQIGIRSMCSEETYHFEKNRMYYASEVKGKKDWLKRFAKQLTKKTYLTIDMDVFDPSIMPSTGTPEPDGLLYAEVLQIVRTIMDHSELVGFDVVELCPNENNKAPDFLAAKLIYQILSYRFKT